MVTEIIGRTIVEEINVSTIDTHSDASYVTSVARSNTIRALIDDPHATGREGLRVLTGDRPTGPLHVGHYFATLKSRVNFQDKGIETIIVIADYQVITDRDIADDIEANVLGQIADYLACGIEPARSTIFVHSAVPALNQLILPFLSLVTDGELRRNPTVQIELKDSGDRPLTGLLLTYPVHQAADILFCHGNVVPVGRDQLPHLEQTRVITRRFNARYGELFTPPDALLTHVPTLLGLDGRKMSTSRGNGISLGMLADETAARVKRARTDSQRRITYDPAQRPEVSSMLVIAGLFTGESPRELADRIGDGGAVRLKQVLTEAVNDGLGAHRQRRLEVTADPSYLKSILHEGNSRANEIADATLHDVREAMGMIY